MQRAFDHLFSFYTFIPATPPFQESRTFIVLPKRTSRQFPYFLQARNTVAPDELQAHTGIFGGKTNDGYYELGLATAKIIRESLMLERGLFDADENTIEKAKSNSTEP